ncbi:hypothetical protein X801_06675 [Opisthorchis viverrini]|uniref:Uncharacterized protein n=1 Tax=Opisthorchis viverrini TaxID=6198 RepID=A0A1S8WSV7_OPIVI|nr:hypothetical protein X801_06675 [Opisthorchis viverrini]
MALFRPIVYVFKVDGTPSGMTIKMPAAFSAPLRSDLLNWVHDQMRKNSRQPYAVGAKAGHQTSAKSCGTARGHRIDRLPEVPLVISDDIESF